MKKTLYRKSIAGFLALVMILGLLPGIHKAHAEDILNINADVAILVDAETGKILYQKMRIKYWALPV